MDEATGTKIVISEDSLENLHWNPVKNEGEFASSSMNDVYPDGYRIEAVNMDIYSGDGTSLIPGRNPTDASGGKGPYVKQE